jgi:hypothetical protein
MLIANDATGWRRDVSAPVKSFARPANRHNRRLIIYLGLSRRFSLQEEVFLMKTTSSGFSATTRFSPQPGPAICRTWELHCRRGISACACDKLLMTGSGLYLADLAGQTAIGQKSRGTGRARMHAEISGTVDFREQDDHPASSVFALADLFQGCQPTRCRR